MQHATIVIPDHQRSAFGLGWEYRRRGDSMEANPFMEHPWKEKAFKEGYRLFKTPKGDTVLEMT